LRRVSDIYRSGRGESPSGGLPHRRREGIKNGGILLKIIF
jgi:hypothetical protein